MGDALSHGSKLECRSEAVVNRCYKSWRAIASDLVVYGMNTKIYCCDAVTCFAVTSSSYCEQCV